MARKHGPQPALTRRIKFSQKGTRLENVNNFIKSLVTRKKQHIAGIRRGMVKGADLIFEESQRLVPKEYHVLKESGEVTLEALTENVRVEISYTAPYAVHVHERLDLAHGQEYNVKYAEDIASGRKTPREPQEQAKYLEAAIRKKRREALQAIRKEPTKIR